MSETNSFNNDDTPMNKKQKEKLFNGCSSFVKWTATIILAFGLSMQLSTTGSEDIVIASLGLMFTGVVLFIVYSIILIT